MNSYYKKACFILLFFIFLIQSQYSIGQEKYDYYQVLAKVQHQIMSEQFDSAAVKYDLFIESDLEYVTHLKDAINNKGFKTGKDRNFFFRQTVGNMRTDYEVAYTYFTENISPETDGTIDLQYCEILWHLSDHLIKVDLKKAKNINELFKKYLLKFKGSDKKVLKARILQREFDLKMILFSEDFSAGLKLSEELLQIAESIEDTNMIVQTKGRVLYFKIKTDKSFESTIESLNLHKELYEIEKDRTRKSSHFLSSVYAYLIALVKQDKSQEKIMELLDILSNSPMKGAYYTSCVNFLGRYDSTQYIYQETLKLLENTSMEEACANINEQAKEELSREYYQDLLQQISGNLEAKGHYKEANKYLKLEANSIKGFYSKELSKTIASHEIDVIEANSELKLTEEKSKRQMTILILVVVLTFLLLSTIIIIRIRKQKKRIQKQNVALEKSDQEKSILLREINHRVKNNFQIICSLLELQSKDIEDEKALELVTDGQNRVKSMALIHQKLYQNDDLEILFDEYVEKLFLEIKSIYKEYEVTPKFHLEKGLSLDIDTAIPLGLILNELITNAFKYAMKKDELNNLSFYVEKFEDQYLMTVKDFGPGISDKIDLKKTKSIGLRLIRRLSKQLQGKMEYQYESGSEFRIYFKDTYMRKDIA